MTEPDTRHDEPSAEQPPPSRQKLNGPLHFGMGAAIGIGAGVGLALGTLVGNLAAGLAVGAGLGVVAGAVLESRGRR